MIGMARQSDSFFIRANVTSTNTGFTETEIDLGAYVDALGKSVQEVPFSESVGCVVQRCSPGKDG